MMPLLRKVMGYLLTYNIMIEWMKKWRYGWQEGDEGLIFIIFILDFVMTDFYLSFYEILEFSTFICRIYKLFNAIKKTNLYCICPTTVLVFKLYSDLSLKFNIIPRPLQRHPILEICLLCSSSILPKKLCIDLVMWNNLEVSPSS